MSEGVAMTKRDIPAAVRKTGGMIGEFIFVVAMLFGSLGIAVVLFVGMDALQSGGLIVFSVVLIIAAIHHRWYSRNREEIESSREQKALRERRGF